MTRADLLARAASSWRKGARDFFVSYFRDGELVEQGVSFCAEPAMIEFLAGLVARLSVGEIRNLGVRAVVPRAASVPEKEVN